jgi:hypothetical protein
MVQRDGKHELKILNRVAEELAQAKDLPQLKSLRDKAEAARQYARSASLSLEIQNFAAEIKLRAERRAGALLDDLVPHGGNRRSSRHEHDLKLSDLGINSGQSSRWRREAAVPEPLFERYVAAAKDLGRDITSQGLLRLHRIIVAEGSNGQSPTLAGRRSNSFGSHGAPSIDSVRFQNGGCLSESPTASMMDLVDEITNHCDLLSRILRPLYDEEASSIKPCERRMVARLFAEIQAIHSQMRVLCLADAMTATKI